MSCGIVLVCALWCGSVLLDMAYGMGFVKSQLIGMRVARYNVIGSFKH